MRIYSEWIYEGRAWSADDSPLMPIVHWPTFSQQLVAREDEKSETWRAFLLSLGTESAFREDPQLTLSHLLDHPTPKIRPDVLTRQGATKTTSTMSY